MRRIEPYTTAEREQIIEDYLQSGLTVFTYCKRPEVTVTITTLKRWMKALNRDEAHEVAEHGIVCYHIEGTQPDEQCQRLSLEEMVRFHQQVYACCCTLQALACTRENVTKVTYLMGVL